MAHKDPRVGARDLRLKLQRKGPQQAHQSGKGSNVGVQDLREKLSGTMHPQPANSNLPKAKAVPDVAKSTRKSAPSVEPSVPDTKRVVNSASRKKQKVEVPENLIMFSSI